MNHHRDLPVKIKYGIIKIKMVSSGSGSQLHIEIVRHFANKANSPRTPVMPPPRYNGNLSEDGQHSPNQKSNGVSLQTQ
jgi:hypothetical protein